VLGKLSSEVDTRGDDRFTNRNILKRALSLLEKSTSAETLDTSNLLLGLASTYRPFLGDDHGEQIRLLKRAHAICEKECGENNEQTAQVVHRLVCASLLGDISEICEYLSRLVDIFERMEPRSAWLKTSLRHLAVEFGMYSAVEGDALRLRLNAIDKTILDGL
jgi:hypothetical protein